MENDTNNFCFIIPDFWLEKAPEHCAMDALFPDLQEAEVPVGAIGRTPG